MKINFKIAILRKVAGILNRILLVPVNTGFFLTNKMNVSPAGMHIPA